MHARQPAPLEPPRFLHALQHRADAGVVQLEDREPRQRARPELGHAVAEQLGQAEVDHREGRAEAVAVRFRLAERLEAGDGEAVAEAGDVGEEPLEPLGRQAARRGGERRQRPFGERRGNVRRRTLFLFGRRRGRRRGKRADALDEPRALGRIALRPARPDLHRLVEFGEPLLGEARAAPLERRLRQLRRHGPHHFLEQRLVRRAVALPQPRQPFPQRPRGLLELVVAQLDEVRAVERGERAVGGLERRVARLVELVDAEDLGEEQHDELLVRLAQEADDRLGVGLVHRGEPARGARRVEVVAAPGVDVEEELRLVGRGQRQQRQRVVEAGLDDREVEIGGRQRPHQLRRARRGEDRLHARRGGKGEETPSLVDQPARALVHASIVPPLGGRDNGFRGAERGEGRGAGARGAAARQAPGSCPAASAAATASAVAPISTPATTEARAGRTGRWTTTNPLSRSHVVRRSTPSRA